MTIPTKHTPDVDTLAVQIADTLTRVDGALDAGDRRAFKVWSQRYGSLTARLGKLLAAIVTTEA